MSGGENKLNKSFRKILSAACVASLLLGLSGCGQTQTSYDSYTLTPKVYYGPDSAKESGSAIDEDPTSQLTEADIQKMNNGKARFVYGNQGYVSFINGRYSDIKVNDHEDAILTLQRVAGLIGLGAGSEFFASHGSRDARGYTYYTFQQRYGESTVLYAVLTVIVDPEGYTAGLSCSFTPNIGIAKETVDIGPDKAMEILKSYLTDYDLTYYPEYTHKIALTIGGNTYNVYALYSSNPTPSSLGFYMPYYEFFVTTDGTFIKETYYPVASIGTDNFDATRSEDYFKELQTVEHSFTVTKYDGSKETITVPISYNSSTGTWYLADANRKIAVGDYNSMDQNQLAVLTKSTNGTDWRNQDLLAYDRYIKAYDYYASLGLQSVDGVGIPILILTSMPDNNACYCGIIAGWACFATSDLNCFSEAMDVVGHEYTHGIYGNSMISHKYQGITGAINESYADIMGNIMEMIYGMTSDTKWLLGENAGYIMRSMSSPRDYQQPISIYDSYYADPGNIKYDNGGVHDNNSLLSQMAYKLWQEGMSLEQERTLWLTTIDMLTPLSGYKEVLECLLLSIDINKFDSSYKDFLIEAFSEAGLLD